MRRGVWRRREEGNKETGRNENRCEERRREENKNSETGDEMRVNRGMEQR